MHTRVHTGVMNTTAAAATRHTAPVAPRLAGVPFGHIDVHMKRDTPMFLGEASGKEHGYGTLRLAMRGAARTSIDAGDRALAQVILHTPQADGRERYFTYTLEQPVWADGGGYSERSTWFRENAYHTSPAEFSVPVAGAPTSDTLTWTSSGRTDDPTGRLVVDNAELGAQLVGIVSGDKALVNGQLQTVEPAPKPRPPAPKPPKPWTPDGALLRDVSEAVRLLGIGVETLQTIDPQAAKANPADPAIKVARKKVYDCNMTAQGHIETQFQRDDAPAALVTTLRQADAFLEDANWQVVPKPSPDGRFNGIDIPGATRDTKKAARILGDLLGELTKPTPAPAA
jgi:hypothetical protein